MNGPSVVDFLSVKMYWIVGVIAYTVSTLVLIALEGCLGHLDWYFQAIVRVIIFTLTAIFFLYKRRKTLKNHKEFWEHS